MASELSEESERDLVNALLWAADAVLRLASGDREGGEASAAKARELHERITEAQRTPGPRQP